jgi:hypothetical protein
MPSTSAFSADMSVVRESSFFLRSARVGWSPMVAVADKLGGEEGGLWWLWAAAVESLVDCEREDEGFLTNDTRLSRDQ